MSAARYIRLNELVGCHGAPGMIPVARSTIWQWVKDGKFPQPIKLGPGVTVWALADVLEFLEKCRKAE